MTFDEAAWNFCAVVGLIRVCKFWWQLGKMLWNALPQKKYEAVEMGEIWGRTPDGKIVKVKPLPFFYRGKAPAYWLKSWM